VPTSYLSAHIDLLERGDTAYKAFWTSLTEDAQRNYRKLWNEIDGSTRGDLLSREYSSANDTTQRWFLRVQEKEFQYSKIPSDWIQLVRDMSAKQHLYELGLARLTEFISLSGVKGLRVYGGIKPDESLDRKIFESRQGNAVQVNLLDLWDVVRFRIVAEDLDTLLEVSVKFWEWMFGDILRCRNYYYRPRLGNPDDAYRAIHFELVADRERMVEVQMMTRCREAIGLLDHALLFKKTLQFLDANHRQWLIEFSKKGNVYDFLRASGPAGITVREGDDQLE
jgi:hypothetical protein